MTILLIRIRNWKATYFMRIEKRIQTIAAVLLSATLVVACGSGPSKRYTDGLWDVSENICSSSPENPDLGDMRSEIRQREIHDTSYQRVINMYHLDNQILRLSQHFDRGGSSGEITLYENSDSNAATETIRVRNNREVNREITDAIEKYFESDPDINGEQARSFCLYRGQ